MLAEGKLGEAGDLWVAQWQKAVQDGDTPAAKFIVDNLEGLLTQKTESRVIDDKILESVAETVSDLYGEDKVVEFMSHL
jgi:hypothetical protein